MPQAPIKLKDRTIIAVALAVGLHLLLAALIYFFVFNNNTLPDESGDNKAATPTFIVTKAHTDSATTDAAADIKIETHDATTETHDVKKVESIKDPITANKPQKPKSVSQEIKQPNHVDTTAAAPNAAITNSPAAPKTPDVQSDAPVYQLKPTQEYEQLDDDIEQDSEQLAELIGEIKDRNQRQIEQRQSEMANAQIPPNSVPQADPPQDPMSE